MNNKNEHVFIVHVGQVTKLVRDCIVTLRQANPSCDICFFTIPEQTNNLELLNEYGVKFYRIDKNFWNGRRMTCKIEYFSHFVENLVPDDSKVIISDSDIVFQSDPFKVFENDFDLFYTSRGYTHKYSINAGFWGLRKNEKTVSLLNHFKKEILNPEWEEFIKFREKEKRLSPPEYENYIDWWSDQDYLCVLHDCGSHPEIENLSIFDATNRFNFCPDSRGPQGPDQAQNEMLGKIGNLDYPVLHFKGQEFKRWYSEGKFKVKNFSLESDYLTKSKAEIYRAYDDNPYDGYMAKFGERITQISQSYKKEISVLDLACGTGRYFHRFSNVERLHGVDYSSYMLEKAKEPTRASDCEWWPKKEEVLTLFHSPADEFCRIAPDSHYDFICCIGTMAEYKKPEGNEQPKCVVVEEELFNNIARLMKPGATFLFTAHQNGISATELRNLLLRTEMSDMKIEIEQVSYNTWRHSLVTVTNQGSSTADDIKGENSWKRILKKF